VAAVSEVRRCCATKVLSARWRRSGVAINAVAEAARARCVVVYMDRRKVDAVKNKRAPARRARRQRQQKTPVAIEMRCRR